MSFLRKQESRGVCGFGTRSTSRKGNRPATNYSNWTNCSSLAWRPSNLLLTCQPATVWQGTHGEVAMRVYMWSRKADWRIWVPMCHNRQMIMAYSRDIVNKGIGSVVDYHVARSVAFRSAGRFRLGAVPGAGYDRAGFRRSAVAEPVLVHTGQSRQISRPDRPQASVWYTG